MKLNHLLELVGSDFYETLHGVSADECLQVYRESLLSIFTVRYGRFSDFTRETGTLKRTITACRNHRKEFHRSSIDTGIRWQFLF